MSEELKREALAYHAAEPAGKLQILPTKPMATQRDLSLAYSPGVAYACTAIEEDPATAALYTGRANLVAVISNGTAVLGLGNIGALASKPVMEGKAALFKKFSGIDVMDLEVDETKVEEFVEAIARLEPTFGGINLEDISAPACFEIEKQLKARMKIPVFHDDQHGTAIVTAAGILNALEVTGRKIETVRITCNGAGAAAIACLNLLVSFGASKDNILVCDRKGVIHAGRTDLDQYKGAYAAKTEARSLADAMKGADIFLGLSAKDSVTQDMVKSMAAKPIIFAMANPDPEIRPELVHEVRDDAIVATGRSDYPNQVNNVLCFPFIFRGALDVGATVINDEMQIACVEGIAALARASSSAEAARAYQGERLSFGRNYLIPKAFDPRLLAIVAGAVAQAAMESGVATRPVADIEAYKAALNQSVFRSAFIMRRVFDVAHTGGRRIVFAEGEDERVLHAAHAVIQEGVGRPVLIGRPEVIERRCERAAIPLVAGRDFEQVNPESDPRYRDYWETYHRIMERRGVTPDLARAIMRTNTTAIGAVMVHRGDADSLICGTFGQYLWHLNYVEQVLGTSKLHPAGALSLMIHERGVTFIADTHVHAEPNSQQIADVVVATARHVRRFGLAPKIALCSHSQFGSLETDSGRRMRGALEILDAQNLDFEYEGEMHSDAALDPEVRARLFPNSRLEGVANALVYANTDAASGTRNIIKMVAGGLEVGPILMGMGNRAQIVTPSITARGLLNIAALAGAPVQSYG